MKAIFATLLLALSLNLQAEPITTQYTTQILEPTGGKISRPKDWFYVEAHNDFILTWIISKEDTAQTKSYQTGLIIQAFVDVKKRTGKASKQIMQDFIASKKSLAQVISVCDEVNQGLFTRGCIETEEGPYHVVYSLFWGNNDLDLAVVTTASSPKEQWQTYAPAFEKMSNFELFDIKRFNKK